MIINTVVQNKNFHSKEDSSTKNLKRERLTRRGGNNLAISPKSSQQSYRQRLKNNFKRKEKNPAFKNFRRDNTIRSDSSEILGESVSSTGQFIQNFDYSKFLESYLEKNATTERRLNKYLNSDLVTPRLYRLLSTNNVGTHNDIKELIISGRISVNGEPAHISQRIKQDDLIKINGQPFLRKRTKKPPRFVLYNKSFEDSVNDQKNTFNVSNPVRNQFPKLRYGQWICIGNIDSSATGLLILTDSLDIANRIVSPRYRIEHEYLICTSNEINIKELRLSFENSDFRKGKKILFFDFIGQDNSNYWYKLVLSDSEINSILKNLGIKTICVVCTRFGNIVLPANLHSRKWKELDSNIAQALIMQMGLINFDNVNLGKKRYHSKQPNSHDNALPPGFNAPRSKNFTKSNFYRQGRRNSDLMVAGGYANGHPLVSGNRCFQKNRPSFGQKKSNSIGNVSSRPSNSYYSKEINKSQIPGVRARPFRIGNEYSENERFSRKQSNGSFSGPNFSKRIGRTDSIERFQKFSKIKKSRNEPHIVTAKKRINSNRDSIKKHCLNDDNWQPKSAFAHKSRLGSYEYSKRKK